MIRVLEKFLVILMMILTLNVLWGVITRYIFNLQASWTEELARYLMIWIALLGAAYATSKKLHLSIPLIFNYINDENKRILETFISGLILFFALSVMIVGGIQLMLLTNLLGQLSPALRWPMWMVYSIIPLSGVLVIVFTIKNTIDLWK
jgi:TRAP-type C4-dicarboxylate transport system permease small subunit